MSEPTTLPELQAAIVKETQRYHAHAKAFSALAALVVPPEECDTYIVGALQYGADQMADTLTGPLRAIPGPVPPDLKANLATQLTHIIDASERLDLLVASREAILQNENPKHLRAYAHMGREFVINPDNATITFKDAPALGYALNAQPIEPTKAPGYRPAKRKHLRKSKDLS